MSRGDRKKDIYLDAVDWQDFLKTLAETCQKTGFQVHAYCLMRNHFHLTVETPNANLVAGMRWLLSTYTIRLGTCEGRDCVRLNPVRAKLLGPKERLLEYPWSSLGWYLSVPEHRPAWMRVDRLLGERGIGKDTAAGREQFERRMEQRRREESDERQWKPVKRGWFPGSAEFRAKLLEQMDGKLGEHHSGRLRQESAEAKGERIIAEELKRLEWKEWNKRSVSSHRIQSPPR